MKRMDVHNLWWSAKICKSHESDFVPDMGTRPTNKTSDAGAPIGSYRFMNQRWSGAPDAAEAGGLEKAFF